MKPLSVEELKALEVGDWVWVVDFAEQIQFYARHDEECEIVLIGESMADEWAYTTADSFGAYDYSHYGDTWLAYKNKEQAECKGEIVETGKYFIEPEQLPNRPLRYLICDYSISKGIRDMCDTYAEAERRLAELKGK